MRPSVLTVLLPALVLSSRALAQDVAMPYQHRLNLSEGDTFAVKTTNEFKVEQSIGGTAIPSVQNSGENVTGYRVAGIEPDGTFQIEVTELSIKSRVRAPMMKLDYDSTTGAEPLDYLDKFMAARVNQVVWIRVSPDGTVLDARGVEENRNAALQVAAFPMGHPVYDQVRAEIESSATTENFIRSTTSMFKRFPSKPVNIGESWTEENTASQMNMKLVNATTRTLAGVTGGQLKVDTTTNTRPEVEGGPGVAGTASGSTTVHAGTGLPMNWTFQTSLAGFAQNMGMKVDLKINVTESGELRPTAGKLMEVFK